MGKGYLIERIISKLPSARYNDLAEWRYTELSAALGCVDWFTARVTTSSELDAALEKARSTNAGVYIEVVTGMWDAPPLAEQFSSHPASERG
ncbi:hypothetical protein B2J88_28570 [Rhodococcus sp. SRB_17]|uniref:hypothetical protein n=1 Tax=Rhodococcus sp. OK302 TaxID=1882769 RepID=UPI000B943826|nr:hypothetical protein [Rhodococcus sp. OK302]NMM88259.1 hypothetical protein [Rhodococcus sp. SRB_17]